MKGVFSMFYRNSEMKYRIKTDTFSQKVLARGGDMMLTEAGFAKDSTAPAHSHPNQQLAYVARGKVSFRIGEEEWTCSEGDSLYVPPDVEHEVTALEEDSIVIDIFSPQREDFLE